MNLDSGRRNTDSITWIDYNIDKINFFIDFYTVKLINYVEEAQHITIPETLTKKIKEIKELIIFVKI